MKLDNTYFAVGECIGLRVQNLLDIQKKKIQFFHMSSRYN